MTSQKTIIEVINSFSDDTISKSDLIKAFKDLKLKKKEATKETKEAKAPSKYILFMKLHMHDEDVKALPPKEKMSKVASMWKELQAECDDQWVEETTKILAEMDAKKLPEEKPKKEKKKLLLRKKHSEEEKPKKRAPKKEVISIIKIGKEDVRSPFYLFRQECYG
jgi:hypothetical protein